jgi:putative FmdB family regulatory protein
MPIYEYRCSDCGFQDEYLRKVSEPPLTVCPKCGKASFHKLVSAAGFQLKGSGWYATDFKSSGKPAPAKAAGDEKGGAKAEAKAETKSDSKPDSGKSESGKSEAKPATPAPASTN